ncbi:MAG: glycosyltransferase [Gemmatimonadota bacterium]|nr:glycosyltransferase [Gemmatimonadota bacterium]
MSEIEPTPSAARARTQPLVTVCVPTVGRLEYLEQALASLTKQTYQNREVLILDNASPPDAREVLGRFAARHPDVRVLRVDERVAMFANFNRGVEAARGEYVVFCHDDDVFLPTFLERYVELLELYPSAGFASGNYDLIGRQGELLRHQRIIKRTELWSGHRFIDELCKTGRSPFSTPGIVFRRSVLERFGFDEQVTIYWGDFTILMRMAEICDVAVLAETQYSWRKHGENESAGWLMSDGIPLRTEVLSAYLAEFRARHPEYATFAAQLERRILRTHRNGLVWGWLSAPNNQEADVCLKLLSASFPTTRLTGALTVLQRLGLSSERRRALLPIFRRVGEAFKA